MCCTPFTSALIVSLAKFSNTQLPGTKRTVIGNRRNEHHAHIFATSRTTIL